jgi:hypothetical protein
MNDAPYPHGQGPDEETVRAAVEALGADAEIARRAGVPQVRVGRFRNGYERLSAREAAAVAAAIGAIKATRDAAGDAVRSSAAGSRKGDQDANLHFDPEAAGAAPGAGDGGQADDGGDDQAGTGAGVGDGDGGQADADGKADADSGDGGASSSDRSDAGDGGQAEDGFAGLLAKAAALGANDIEGAKAIIAAAVLLLVDDLEKGRLLNELKKRLGKGADIAALRAIWNRAAARLRPSPEALAAAAAAAREAEKEAERARLWPIVEKLANRRDLIEHAAHIVQALGVVGERKAIKANYIAMSSRILGEGRVLSVVNTGVSSVGKSHLMTTVARLLPPECVEVITSGSAKSLVFMVGEDPRALSHKVILLHETAGFIASSDTEGNPSATLVREMLTGGRIRYNISEKSKSGQFVTRKIEVEGPISLNTTSARANLDPEMENRLLEVPVDESPKATRDIQMAQLSGETARRARDAAPAVEELIALQRWLQSAEGLRVVIPDDLLDSIMAVGGLPLTVQTRRDIPLFLCAVRACAAIHLARRRRDAEGRVIAEFEDYEAAHDAIDGFLAASYSTTLKPTEIAVLAAVESLIAEDQKRRKAIEAALKPGAYVSMDHLNSKEAKAQFTYDELAARLRMKSRKTLARRVKALKLAKAVALVVERSGHGTVSTWELLIPSQQAAAAARERFMPPPEAVIELLVDPVTRRKQLDRLAEDGSATDWRAYAAGGGANDGDDATAGDRREDEDHEGEDDGEEAV